MINGDKTWVFHYDPKTNKQNSEWHAHIISLSKGGLSKQIKTEIHAHSLLWHQGNNAQKEFVIPRQTVNTDFYKKVLQRLKNQIAHINLKLKNNWILHHDNASAHTSFKVTQFLVKHSTATLPQPLYSTDLSFQTFFYSLS